MNTHPAFQQFAHSTRNGFEQFQAYALIAPRRLREAVRAQFRRRALCERPPRRRRSPNRAAISRPASRNSETQGQALEHSGTTSSRWNRGSFQARRTSCSNSAAATSGGPPGLDAVDAGTGAQAGQRRAFSPPPPSRAAARARPPDAAKAFAPAMNPRVRPPVGLTDHGNRRASRTSPHFRPPALQTPRPGPACRSCGQLREPGELADRRTSRRPLPPSACRRRSCQKPAPVPDPLRWSCGSCEPGGPVIDARQDNTAAFRPAGVLLMKSIARPDTGLLWRLRQLRTPAVR